MRHTSKTKHITETSISKIDSDILATARILMIVSLVIHHVFTIPNSGFFPRFSLSDETLSVANALNAFLHWGSMAAVPTLSIASGFLFFASKRSFTQKLNRRLLTVILPTVFWCAIWFEFSYLLYIFGHEKGLFGWANYGFEQLSLLDFTNGIIGITKEPFAFQFWFIHDLVLTILLAPVINFTLNRAFWPTLITLSVIWLADAIPFPFFSGNVLVFFTFGAAIQKSRGSITAIIEILWPLKYIIVTLFALGVIARALNEYIHVSLASYQYLCLLRLLGVMSCGIIILGLYRHQHLVFTKIKSLSIYSFFIFASHYPIIEIVKTIVQRLPGQSSEVGLFISLIAIPLVTILCCIAGAMTLKRLLPWLYNPLNGQRH